MKLGSCRTEVVIDFVLLLLVVYCVTVTCDGPCRGKRLMMQYVYVTVTYVQWGGDHKPRLHLAIRISCAFTLVLNPD